MNREQLIKSFLTPVHDGRCGMCGEQHPNLRAINVHWVPARSRTVERLANGTQTNTTYSSADIHHHRYLICDACYQKERRRKLLWVGAGFLIVVSMPILYVLQQNGILMLQDLKAGYGEIITGLGVGGVMVAVNFPTLMNVYDRLGRKQLIKDVSTGTVKPQYSGARLNSIKTWTALFPDNNPFHKKAK